MFRKQWKNIDHYFCDLCPAAESVDHLILRYAPAHYVWSKLGVLQQATRSHSLLAFVIELQVINRHWYVLFAACAVQLWKVRNARVFDNIAIPNAASCYAIAEMVQLWCSRTNDGALKAFLRAKAEFLLAAA